MKIKINRVRGGSMGDQRDYGLVTGSVWNYELKPDTNRVSDTLSPVPRDEANIEAERGETIVGDLNNDGMVEHAIVGGKRHFRGGTPLNVPDGSFVFSDYNKLKIKNKDLLKGIFNYGGSKGATPAQVAKRYELNKYVDILNDPESDALDKKTAQLMLDNNMKKLGQLALVQEGMKGFPDGIPDIAAPLFASDIAVSSPSQQVMKRGGLVKYQAAGQKKQMSEDENSAMHDRVRKKAFDNAYKKWLKSPVGSQEKKDAYQAMVNTNYDIPDDVKKFYLDRMTPAQRESAAKADSTARSNSKRDWDEFWPASLSMPDIPYQYKHSAEYFKKHISNERAMNPLFGMYSSPSELMEIDEYVKEHEKKYQQAVRDSTAQATAQAKVNQYRADLSSKPAPAGNDPYNQLSSLFYNWEKKWKAALALNDTEAIKKLKQEAVNLKTVLDETDIPWSANFNLSWLYPSTRDVAWGSEQGKIRDMADIVQNYIDYYDESGKKASQAAEFRRKTLSNKKVLEKDINNAQSIVNTFVQTGKLPSGVTTDDYFNAQKLLGQTETKYIKTYNDPGFSAPVGSYGSFITPSKYTLYNPSEDPNFIYNYASPFSTLPAADTLQTVNEEPVQEPVPPAGGDAMVTNQQSSTQSTATTPKKDNNVITIDPTSGSPNRYYYNPGDTLGPVPQKEGGSLQLYQSAGTFQQYPRESLIKSNDKFKVVPTAKRYGSFNVQKFDPQTGYYSVVNPSIGQTEKLDIDDFIKRQSAILSKYTGGVDEWKKNLVSPNQTTRESAIDWFQDEYDKFRQASGFSPYFFGRAGDSKTGAYARDKKFGVYTFSAPGITAVEPTPPATNPPAANPPADGGTQQKTTVGDPPMPQYTQGAVGAPWWNYDIVNYANQLANYYDIEQGNLPPYQTFNPYVANPVYVDPARAIAQQQGLTAQTQEAIGAISNPTQARANQIAAAAKASEPIANIMAQYDNQNAQIANQFSQQNAQVMNQAQLQNLNFRKRYADEIETRRQQYLNALREGRTDVAESIMQGMKNAAETSWVNATSDSYAADPRTGTVYFKQGFDPTTGAYRSKNTLTYADWVKANGLEGVDQDALVKAYTEYLSDQRDERAQSPTRRRSTAASKAGGKVKYMHGGVVFNPIDDIWNI
jgi:hypothetical protein